MRACCTCDSRRLRTLSAIVDISGLAKRCSRTENLISFVVALLDLSWSWLMALRRGGINRYAGCRDSGFVHAMHGEVVHGEQQL